MKKPQQLSAIQEDLSRQSGSSEVLQTKLCGRGLDYRALTDLYLIVMLQNGQGWVSPLIRLVATVFCSALHSSSALVAQCCPLARYIESIQHLTQSDGSHFTLSPHLIPLVLGRPGSRGPLRRRLVRAYTLYIFIQLELVRAFLLIF